MPFTAEAVVPLGLVPNTTAHRFGVEAQGERLGTVRVPSILALLTAGVDVPAWVARRLTAIEERRGLGYLRELLRHDTPI